MASGFIISEITLTVSIIVLAALFSGMMLSASSRFENVYSSSIESLTTRLNTDIKIVMAVKSAPDEVKIWVKNVGKTVIYPSIVAKSNLIFGPEGNFKVVPYNAGSPPTWSFNVENDLDGDGNWDPQELSAITIHWDSNLVGGDYIVKFELYGCIGETYIFKIV